MTVTTPRTDTGRVPRIRLLAIPTALLVLFGLVACGDKTVSAANTGPTGAAAGSVQGDTSGEGGATLPDPDSLDNRLISWNAKYASTMKTQASAENTNEQVYSIVWDAMVLAGDKRDPSAAYGVLDDPFGGPLFAPPNPTTGTAPRIEQDCLDTMTGGPGDTVRTCDSDIQLGDTYATHHFKLRLYVKDGQQNWLISLVDQS